MRPARIITASSMASPRSSAASLPSSMCGSKQVRGRANGPTARDRRVTDLVSPGDRPGALAGRLRAVPRLEPGPQRGPAEAARLEHPPERQVLPDVPGRDPPRDCDRALHLLLARLGADPAWA